MTLFLGLEWFSIALYVLCAIDIDLVGSLEAGLKYLIIGAVGSATLLFGSALVYGATGQLGFDKIGAAGPHARLAARARPRDGDRRARVQGLGGAVPHVDARRLPGRADAGDRVHVARRRRSRRSSSPTGCSLTAFPADEQLWTWAIAGIAMRLARDRQHRRARAAEREAAARLLLGLARRLHADRRSRRANALGARALIYYLIPYCAMSLGAFAVVAARERELGAPVTLDNLAGLRLGAAVPRRLDVGLHARLPRLPAHRRLLGQVLRLRGRLRRTAGGG